MHQILVIDIDINIQPDLQVIGKKLDIQFYFTNSIQKAWPILEKIVTIDAIFLENQIGQEYGWQFANQLQKHICFHLIPIIVFASKIDKESIKKYVQSKVTHILRKPYTQNAIEAHLNKIKNRCWYEDIFLDPQLVCTNLSIEKKAYFERYQMAADDVQQGINDLLFACDRPKSSKFQSALSQIKLICNELGFPFMTKAIEQLTKISHKLELEDLVAMLNGLKPMVKLMRKRAYQGLGIEDPELEKPSEKPAPIRHLQRISPPKRIKPPTSNQTNTRNSFRSITNTTLEEFSPFFEPLLKKSSFTKKEVIQQCLSPESLPFSNEMLQDLKVLLQSEHFDFRQALSYVWKVPLLANRLIDLAIANNQIIAPDEEEERNTGELAKSAVNALGFDYVFFYYCILRFFGFTNKLKAPIDLEPVFTRVLARILTAYHLCHLLKVKQTTLISFLCMGQNLGTFLLSSIYPFYYAANLIRANNNPERYYQGQRDLFGLTEIELTVAYLRHYKFNENYANIVLNCLTPERASNKENQFLAAIVNLADTYAREKLWGYDGYLLPEETPELSELPAWEIIRDFGLPLDKDLSIVIANFQNSLHHIERELRILI